ncbi:MAG: hypothetical protein WHT06_07395 [Desulfobacterales bacterium]
METNPMESATPASPPAAVGRWVPGLRGLLLLTLAVLCGAGFVAAPFRPQSPTAFWMGVTAIFGVLCLGVCLLAGSERSRRDVLIDQVLLWLGAAALVRAVLWLIERQHLPPEVAGPVPVLLIAFAVYVSGVRFAGPLLPIALLMAAGVVGAVVLERILLLAGGLALVLVLAAFFARPLLRAFRGSRPPEPPPGPAAGAS